MCLAGVGSVATSGVSPGAGLRVRTLSKLFIGNNLLLKLLRIFFLALNNNPKLFIPLSKPFKSLAKLRRLLSAFSINICPWCVSY